MYKCATCKGTFNGIPRLKNNAGEFCEKCDSIRLAKMEAGIKKRSIELGDKCQWCGDDIHNRKEGTHVCNDCQKKRDWLLKCIRFSDKPANYVARVEEKERIQRLERERKQSELSHKITKTAPQTNENNPSELSRIDKIEEMLLRLTNALGGV